MVLLLSRQDTAQVCTILCPPPSSAFLGCRCLTVQLASVISLAIASVFVIVRGTSFDPCHALDFMLLMLLLQQRRESHVVPQGILPKSCQCSLLWVLGMFIWRAHTIVNVQ